MEKKLREEQIRSIAEYLGANDGEMWSEILPILEEVFEEGRKHGEEVAREERHFD